MRSVSVVPPALAISLTVLLTACGSGSGSTSDSRDSFPVTLLRKGGVAGFDDRIEVAQDGRATATGNRGAGSPCTLEESALRDLTSLASHVQGTAETTYEMPDDLILVVQTPKGSSRLGDLDQPELSAVVTHLFEDLFGAPARRTVCQ